MARYYIELLSTNIGETSEGYRICRNCVLARTGFQRYLIRELPQERARELGIDTSDPTRPIDLYRRAEEVFSVKTISSAEGKDVTDTHPRDFVTPETFREYSCGHIQNVRKGSEPLESGDWPLLGDVIIKDPGLIAKIDNNEARQLSLGYDFTIERDGDKILQTDMVVNHCAVVPTGRAGPEARIVDAAPPELIQDAPTTHKEKRMKGNSLIGRVLKAFALDGDTTEEELAEAAKKLTKDNEPPGGELSQEESERAEMALDRARRRKAARDLEEAENTGPQTQVLDCYPGRDGHERCTKGKCLSGNAMDAAEEYRKEVHAAFDRLVSSKADDADIAMLKDLLGNFLTEEQKEPEHAKDNTESDEPMAEEEAAMDDEDESEMVEPVEEEEEAVPANDALDALLPIINKSKDPKVRKALDSISASALTTPAKLLRALRPLRCRTPDTAFRRVWDAQCDAVNRSSESDDNTGYGGFAEASTKRATARDGAPNLNVEPDVEKLQKFYNDAYKGKQKVGIK